MISAQLFDFQSSTGVKLEKINCLKNNGLRKLNKRIITDFGVKKLNF